jgi:hypothetical protein
VVVVVLVGEPAGAVRVAEIVEAPTAVLLAVAVAVAIAVAVAVVVEVGVTDGAAAVRVAVGVEEEVALGAGCAAAGVGTITPEKVERTNHAARLPRMRRLLQTRLPMTSSSSGPRHVTRGTAHRTLRASLGVLAHRVPP